MNGKECLHRFIDYQRLQGQTVSRMSTDLDDQRVTRTDGEQYEHGFRCSVCTRADGEQYEHRFTRSVCTGTHSEENTISTLNRHREHY